MGSAAEAFVERWHGIVAERDLEGLREILAEDVQLGAPPYWQKLEGREVVGHLLGIIVETIEGFTYRREWWREGELALEFTGRVGGLELQGIDLISLDDAGRIRSLDVLMRPVNAVVALREAVAPRMVEFLAARSRGAA